jgi:hypothetical protein
MEDTAMFIMAEQKDVSLSWCSRQTKSILDALVELQLTPWKYCIIYQRNTTLTPTTFLSTPLSLYVALMSDK